MFNLNSRLRAIVKNRPADDVGQIKGHLAQRFGERIDRE